MSSLKIYFYNMLALHFFCCKRVVKNYSSITEKIVIDKHKNLSITIYFYIIFALHFLKTNSSSKSQSMAKPFVV